MSKAENLESSSRKGESLAFQSMVRSLSQVSLQGDDTASLLQAADTILQRIEGRRKEIESFCQKMGVSRFDMESILSNPNRFTEKEWASICAANKEVEKGKEEMKKQNLPVNDSSHKKKTKHHPAAKRGWISL